MAAGRWSDVVGAGSDRCAGLALALTALLLLLAASVDLPLPVLVPVVVLASFVSMSWNSLSFAERRRARWPAAERAAIGLQQTVMGIAGSAYPGLFESWSLRRRGASGIFAAAGLPLAGWSVLAV